MADFSVLDCSTFPQHNPGGGELQRGSGGEDVQVYKQSCRGGNGEVLQISDVESTQRNFEDVLHKRPEPSQSHRNSDVDCMNGTFVVATQPHVEFNISKVSELQHPPPPEIPATSSSPATSRILESPTIPLPPSADTTVVLDRSKKEMKITPCHDTDRTSPLCHSTPMTDLGPSLDALIASGHLKTGQSENQAPPVLNKETLFTEALGTKMLGAKPKVPSKPPLKVIAMSKTGIKMRGKAVELGSKQTQAASSDKSAIGRNTSSTNQTSKIRSANVQEGLLQKKESRFLKPKNPTKRSSSGSSLLNPITPVSSPKKSSRNTKSPSISKKSPSCMKILDEKLRDPSSEAKSPSSVQLKPRPSLASSSTSRPSPATSSTSRPSPASSSTSRPVKDASGVSGSSIHVKSRLNTGSISSVKQKAAVSLGCTSAVTRKQAGGSSLVTPSQGGATNLAVKTPAATKGIQTGSKVSGGKQGVGRSGAGERKVSLASSNLTTRSVDTGLNLSNLSNKSDTGSAKGGLRPVVSRQKISSSSSRSDTSQQSQASNSSRSDPSHQSHARGRLSVLTGKTYRANKSPSLSVIQNGQGSKAQDHQSNTTSSSKSSTQTLNPSRPASRGNSPAASALAISTPDLVQVSQTSSQLERIKERLETSEKAALKLRIDAEKRDLGFEALAVVIRWQMGLAEEEEAKTKLDLDKAVKCNKELAEEVNQRKDQQTVTEEDFNKLLVKLRGDIEEMCRKHQEEKMSLREVSRCQQESLKLENQNLLRKQEEGHTRDLGLLEKEFSLKKQRIEKKLLQIRQEVTEKEQARIDEQEKNKQLTEQVQTLEAKVSALVVNLMKGPDYLDESLVNLQKEVDSLRAVMEVKTDELKEIKKEKLLLESDVKEFEKLKGKVRSLQAQVEDLKEQLGRKSSDERKLSREVDQLQCSVEKEARERSRLYREKEQLEWKVREGSKARRLQREIFQSRSFTESSQNGTASEPQLNSSLPPSHLGGSSVVDFIARGPTVSYELDLSTYSEEGTSHSPVCRKVERRRNKRLVDRSEVYENISTSTPKLFEAYQE